MEDQARLNRRSWLKWMGLAGVSVGLHPWQRLLANTPEEHRFVFCFFQGGWDLIMGLDARRDGSSDIQRFTNRFRPDERYMEVHQQAIGQGAVLWGTEVTRALVPHINLLAQFNGLHMGTQSHEEATLYATTGRPGRGGRPQRSTIGTTFGLKGDLGASGVPFPVVSIGGGGQYNLSGNPNLTAINVPNDAALQRTIGPWEHSFAPHVERAMEAYREDAVHCVEPGSRLSLERELELAASRLRGIPDLDVRDLDLNNRGSARVRALQDVFGFRQNEASNSAKRRAALAVLLLDMGLTRSVTVRVNSGSLDTHSADWTEEQGPRQQEGMENLAGIVRECKRMDPGLRNTTILACSEFSRTPLIAGSGGRGHFFTNSLLVFGGGLRPGVYGRSVPGTLLPQRMNLRNLRPSNDGTELRPEHVYATMFASVGLAGEAAETFDVAPLEGVIR